MRGPPAADDPAVTRELAEFMIGRLDNAARGTTDQLVKTSGWLNASLLVINGGGALATMNVVERLHFAFLPGALFGVGILCSLIVGVIIQRIVGEMSDHLEEGSRIWLRARIHGQRDEQAEQALKLKIDKVNSYGRVPQVVGWLSGAFFFAGASSLGWQLVNSQSPAQINRCVRLEADMLAETPKKRDAEQVFTALGCKPALSDIALRRLTARA